MGDVYRAEQRVPIRREVALKLIKLGMDTKLVIARFEAERQALAMMDHPNIAKVLDAGTTDVGRPYFVMELVRGIKITDYCDQASSTTKERLDLFIKVCQAIQHAHQKGIIHRDIKPSNLFLTRRSGGRTVVKVLDFGLAKAMAPEPIGTSASMSPSWSMSPPIWPSGNGSSPRKFMLWPHPICGKARWRLRETARTIFVLSPRSLGFRRALLD